MDYIMLYFMKSLTENWNRNGYQYQPVQVLVGLEYNHSDQHLKVLVLIPIGIRTYLSSSV